MNFYWIHAACLYVFRFIERTKKLKFSCIFPPSSKVECQSKQLRYRALWNLIINCTKISTNIVLCVCVCVFIEWLSQDLVYLSFTFSTKKNFYFIHFFCSLFIKTSLPLNLQYYVFVVQIKIRSISLNKKPFDSEFRYETLLRRHKIMSYTSNWNINRNWIALTT